MASVDVVIPSYQYGHFLRRSVTSVLDQNIDDLRVLIIDNASTDNTSEIAEQLRANDDRVEIVRHRKNLGPHASYNEGVDWAKSDYFLLVDADDFLVDGALNRAISFMEKHPNVVLTYGRAPCIAPNGKMYPGNQVDQRIDWEIISSESFLAQFCARPIHMVPSPTVVRRTSAQKHAGYYRSELPYTDDMELWLRLALLGAVARTGRAQAVQRFHSSQLTAFYTSKMVRDFVERKAAVESFFSHEGKTLHNAASLLANARRALAADAFRSSAKHLVMGKLSASLSLIQFALAKQPKAKFMKPNNTRPSLGKSEKSWQLSSIFQRVVSRSGYAKRKLAE